MRAERGRGSERRPGWGDERATKGPSLARTTSSRGNATREWGGARAGVASPRRPPPRPPPRAPPDARSARGREGWPPGRCVRAAGARGTTGRRAVVDADAKSRGSNPNTRPARTRRLARSRRVGVRGARATGTHLELVHPVHRRHGLSGVQGRARLLERLGPARRGRGGRGEGAGCQVGAFAGSACAAGRWRRGRGAGAARCAIGAYLWKVGEKRFLSSFPLVPRFTAFAALAALALASSARVPGGGWDGERRWASARRGRRFSATGRAGDRALRPSRPTRGDATRRERGGDEAGDAPLAMVDDCATRVRRPLRG